MEKCSIVITSKSEGKTARYTLAGNLEVDGEQLRLNYIQDGDCVNLVLAKDVLEMFRQGDVCLRMNFKQGEQTELVLDGNGSRGTVPLFTNKYRLIRGVDGLFFVCDYLLRYPQSEQRFVLKADVKIISEET